MEEYNYEMALLISRIFLGVLFLMQGYDKVFRVKLPNVIETFKSELGTAGIPAPLIVLAAYFTSWVELLGGLFLIFGFMKYFVLYALGLDLILVAIAMGIREPLWKMEFVFPRLVLLIFLLIVPYSWDLFSLDGYLFH